MHSNEDFQKVLQVFVDSVKNRIDEVDKDNVDVSKLRMHIRKKFSYMQAQKGYRFDPNTGERIQGPPVADHDSSDSDN
ncbi:hypothetical protein WJX79_007999 [Trebouxia sp. C0005]